MDQSIITGASQLITQLSGVVGQAASKITPIVLMAAKMSAMLNALNDSIMIIQIIIFIPFAIFLFKLANKLDKSPNYYELPGFIGGAAIVITALSTLSFIYGLYHFSDLAVSIYGIYHPDFYIAFQAYQKIMG